MTLNDLERHSSPHFVFFFTEFDSFAGRLCLTYNVCNILSPSSLFPLLAKSNTVRTLQCGLSAIAELLIYLSLVIRLF